ncbi:MAG: ATP-binding protein [Candidatus Sumerlaeota bacterium]|nr:ATP-binding protein [Candidatus Sumerlaeota bacterium]
MSATALTPALSAPTPSQLAEAFQAFEQASVTMTRQYEALQRRIEELNLELEEKNKELRESLAERETSEHYLESLLESLSNGVIALASDGVILTVNRAAEEMLGAERAQLIGARMEDFLPALEEQRLGANGGSGGSGANDRNDHKDSNDSDEDGSGADPAKADVSSAVGESITIEEVVAAADGSGDERILELQIRPTLHLPTQPASHLVIMRDVTELRRLERAATLRNRLTAMGEMAMNVAHEVRNPLGSIELFASALRQEMPDDPEQQRLVDFISQGVRSIDTIVNNILMFARQMHPALEPVDPAALLDDVLTYARYHMEQKEISLERTDAADGARCLGDVELLKQVFLNLLLNATQAMDTGGRLRLETHALPYGVEFIVEDNGAGIPPAALAKIFDPFYTTKRRGTGLGLTICHNIIQAHQGTIEVESQLGAGTRFVICVPRA